MAIQRVRVNEGSTKKISFIIRDQDDAPVPLASLTGATLTLYVVGRYEPNTSPTIGILNGREGQDILNANNVTIHSTSGLVTWIAQILDNVIYDEIRQIERHHASFHFAWSGGAYNEEVELEVKNLPSVA